MSKMGDELEKRLSENHYDLLAACKRAASAIRAGFSHNPEIDSAELHVQQLHGMLKPCQDEMEGIINKIERGGNALDRRIA